MKTKTETKVKKKLNRNIKNEAHKNDKAHNT